MEPFEQPKYLYPETALLMLQGQRRETVEYAYSHDGHGTPGVWRATDGHRDEVRTGSELKDAELVWVSQGSRTLNTLSVSSGRNASLRFHSMLLGRWPILETMVVTWTGHNVIIPAYPLYADRTIWFPEPVSEGIFGHAWRCEVSVYYIPEEWDARVRRTSSGR